MSTSDLRIIIVGTSGSGKTTLGKQIAEQLDIPSIDLDDLHWLPNWGMRDLEEFRSLVDEKTAQENWVISGNYSKTKDIYYPKANTLIWLDYSFFRNFKQILIRSICRIKDREHICNGNVETWGKFFSKESIMIWFFKTFWKRSKQYNELFLNPQKNPHLKFIRLKSPKETKAFLETLS